MAGICTLSSVILAAESTAKIQDKYVQRETDCEKDEKRVVTTHARSRPPQVNKNSSVTLKHRVPHILPPLDPPPPPPPPQEGAAPWKAPAPCLTWGGERPKVAMPTDPPPTLPPPALPGRDATSSAVWLPSLGGAWLTRFTCSAHKFIQQLIIRLCMILVPIIMHCSIIINPYTQLKLDCVGFALESTEPSIPLLLYR